MYVWYVAHFKQNAGRATTRRAAVVRGRVKQLGTHTAAVCQTAVSLQWPPSAGREQRCTKQAPRDRDQCVNAHRVIIFDAHDI